jgi:hypothetical protein
MTDLLLDDDHDIAFSENEDGLIYSVDGEAELRQSVKISLLTRLGEYFMDSAAGVGWDLKVFVRPASETQIKGEIVRVCLGVDGVLSVEDLRLSVDYQTRAGVLDVVLLTIYGPVSVTV